MSLYVLINIIIFLVLMAILYVMQKKHIDFTFRVLGALIMGLALGFLFFKPKAETPIKAEKNTTDKVGEPPNPAKDENGFVGIISNNC